MTRPLRVFLDTNIYIIGASLSDSPEAVILHWAGFYGQAKTEVEVTVSDVLFEQILRVAKRIQGKDWGGEIVARIWQGMQVQYVLPDSAEMSVLEKSGLVPREDLEIYLAAKTGHVDCFISANRELVRSLAQEVSAFECLDAAEFVQKYIRP